MDKLSKDAAAAKAAGISYGRWIALQPEKPQVMRYPIIDQENMKYCALCGQPILSGRKDRNRKYCSSECADIARQRQHYKNQQLRRAEQ